MHSEIGLGERIARWREYRGLSQAALASKIVEALRERGLDGGCSPSAVAQWELNQTAPTRTNEHALCDALKITLARFWGPLPAKKAKRAS